MEPALALICMSAISSEGKDTALKQYDLQAGMEILIFPMRASLARSQLGHVGKRIFGTRVLQSSFPSYSLRVADIRAVTTKALTK